MKLYKGIAVTMLHNAFREDERIITNHYQIRFYVTDL